MDAGLVGGENGGRGRATLRGWVESRPYQDTGPAELTHADTLSSLGSQHSAPPQAPTPSQLLPTLANGHRVLPGQPYAGCQPGTGVMQELSGVRASQWERPLAGAGDRKSVV